MTTHHGDHVRHDTMRALVQRTHDGPRDLHLVPDHPRPAAPGPGEYLIRVGAAGLNFADVMQTRGTYAGGPAAPYVAGFEAAGEIVAVGAAVDHPIPIGTHVVGTGPGAFAEYMTMPAGVALPVPTGWTDAEALGLVLNWATALAALRPLGQVQRGDVVLVQAAAGGVGQAAPGSPSTTAPASSRSLRQRNTTSSSRSVWTRCWTLRTPIWPRRSPGGSAASIWCSSPSAGARSRRACR